MPVDPGVALANLEECGVVAEHGPFKLTPVAAIATGQPTFEQWEQALKFCRSVERVSRFWIGDLLLLGDNTFGDLHYSALGTDCDPTTQFHPESLANWKWVAKSIPPSRRRDDVSFGHHQVVAPLFPSEQTEWLKRAADQGLTVVGLRRAIQESKVEPVVVAQPRTVVMVRGEPTTIEIKAPFAQSKPEPAVLVESTETEVLPANADAAGDEAAAVKPAELWISVRCTSVSEQLELAERLQDEGYLVKLITK